MPRSLARPCPEPWRRLGARGAALGPREGDSRGAGPGPRGLTHAGRDLGSGGRSLAVGLPARAVVVAVRAKAGDGRFLAKKAMIYA